MPEIILPKIKVTIPIGNKSFVDIAVFNLLFAIAHTIIGGIKKNEYMIKIIPAGNAAPSSIRKNSIANKKNIKVKNEQNPIVNQLNTFATVFMKSPLYYYNILIFIL